MQRSILAALTFLFFLSGCCKPPDSRSLSVVLNPQGTSMWCWAASGEMVMEFLGTSVDQCDEANKRFSRTDCCNSPVPGGCVVGGWPEFDKYGFAFQKTSDASLTWDQVKSQIGCKSKPYGFAWHWTGGGGHMMVLTGYSTTNGVNFVDINDPWPPNVGDQRTVPYEQYVSGSGYTHWDDYYDVTKK